MNDNTAQTIMMHLQTIRDYQRQQATDVKRIADALEALVALKK